MIMLPTPSDVHLAHARIKPHIIETPLLRPEVLEKRFGFPIFLKCENLQKTGSFKFRGAYNRLSQLEKGTSVVALSSGNHAQGVAKAAEMLGHHATIVMPSDAPAMKINNTRGYGAEVRLYNRATDDRDVYAASVLKEKGGVYVHPFNDFGIIAGQGTIGLEIQAQANMPLDAMLCCCSGGGMTGGISLSFVGTDTKIYAVEPHGFDDLTRSLKAGELLKNEKLSGSICDGLLSQSALPLTWGLAQKYIFGGIVVPDEEVKAAMRFAFNELKLVIEPSGAICLAALLSGIYTPKGATAIIISGGNVDAKFFAEVIEGK
jgi:threonine dehydratase